MEGNRTQETRGHRLLRKWIAADPETRGHTVVAQACRCSRAAVYNWLHKFTRPKGEHRTILRFLAGIDEDAWLYAKDRRAQRAAKRLAAHDRAA
jgi:hypothetical protein